jgi:hypothetical protein
VAERKGLVIFTGFSEIILVVWLFMLAAGHTIFPKRRENRIASLQVFVY